MNANNRSNDMSTPQTISIDGTDYAYEAGPTDGRAEGAGGPG